MAYVLGYQTILHLCRLRQAKSVHKFYQAVHLAIILFKYDPAYGLHI